MILFREKFSDPELQAKAEAIQRRINGLKLIEPEFLLSTYLYSIPENLLKEDRNNYNTDIAVYAWQRALFNTGKSAYLNASDFHYEYVSLLGFSQSQDDDASYNALRTFARDFVVTHPMVIVSTSERIKSLTSHTKKYCINVMRGYHDGGGAHVYEQIDRIHDDKALRMILDMPRSSCDLVTTDELLEAIFDAANTLPEHMRKWRFKMLLANPLLDAESNNNSMLRPDLVPYYKNYAENPKEGNLYRSLHICFENLATREVVECQIRSFEWHFHAEYGPANHDDYKATQLFNVVKNLELDLLDEEEYLLAFLQFMDIINLDESRIIIPNFMATPEGYKLDRAGIFVPVTTEEEMFCTQAKKKSGVFMKPRN